MTQRDLSGDASHLSSEPPVSIIVTVRNEERFLEAAISAALHSEYSGEKELIVAVGPSTDRTEAIARRIADQDSRVKVVVNPSGRTPDGLNAALNQTQNEIIVRIDGHSEISKTYIRDAVKALMQSGAVNVGGVMAAEGISPFERSVARAMRSRIGVGSSRFHTGGEAGSVDTVYLGVFRKDALLKAGGYDSRFTRAQDWELNYRLRKNGGIIWFDPKLSVTYRPRNSISSLARQYFEYGRWRRAVSRTHRGTSNFRYLAPPLNLALQLSSISAGLLISPIFFIPSGTYAIVLLVASILLGKTWAERLFLPFVLITMHFSWGFGFITSPRTLLSK